MWIVLAIAILIVLPGQDGLFIPSPPSKGPISTYSTGGGNLNGLSFAGARTVNAYLRGG